MSFGFGGFGQSSQQPQQPQQQPGFGRQSSFGVFGQQQPQQQSLFGAGTAPFSSSNSKPKNTDEAAFAQPATGGGFGPFGAAQNASGSIFGTNTRPTFGSGTGNANAGFGALGFGASTAPAVPPATGTTQPPFSVFRDRDPQNNLLLFQSISSMPAYRNFSFEELRWADYQEGRKTASGGFGSSTGGQFGGGYGAAGGFGQNTGTTGTTGFGQQNTTSGFGGFGQGTSAGFVQNTGAAGFGQNTGATGATGTTGFGMGANTGFGQGTTGFGQGTNTSFGQGPTAGFGQNTGTTGFGQNTATTNFGQQNTANTGFGSKPAFGTGNTGTTGGLFGGGTAGGSFGAAAQQKPGFGTGTTQQTTGFNFGSSGGGTFGGFGQPAQPANTGTTGFGGFGQQAQQKPLFGANTNQTAAKPMFGTQQTTTNTATPGFGAGLFGTAQPIGGGMFGAATTVNPPATNTTNMFGVQQVVPQTGFGFKPTLATNVTMPQTTNSIFGTSGLFAAPQAPVPTVEAIPSLTASINQAAYSNSLLVPSSSTPATAAAAAAEEAKKEEKPMKSADIPYYKTTPLATQKLRLRGHNSMRSFAGSKSILSSSANKERGPDALLPRTSVKQLTIDLARLTMLQEANRQEEKKTEKEPEKIPEKGPEKQAEKEPEREPEGEQLSTMKESSFAQSSFISQPDRSQVEDGGDYWMIPSYEQLREMSKKDLQSVKNFTVGRRGYGQVTFDDPVDLTAVSILSAIPGHLVVFERKSCTVYPDDVTKPPRGQGLNIPATITVEGVWVVDKATRQPVIDGNDTRVQQKIKRLKSVGETEFVSYVADAGIWTFKVKHFTTYKDEEEEEAAVPKKVSGVGFEKLNTGLFNIRFVKQMAEAEKKSEKPRFVPIRPAKPLKELEEIPDPEYSMESSILSAKHLIVERRRIPYQESISSKKSHDCKEMMYGMSRSFRVGWGPRGQLIHSGQLQPRNEMQSYSISIDRIPATSVVNEAVETLKIVYKNSDATNHPIKFDLEFQEIASLNNKIHDSDLYLLGSALYDPVHQSTQRERQDERKRLLSQWLKQTAQKKMSEELKIYQHTINEVFVYLTGNCVKEACMAAVEQQEMRLATLVAQAGTPGEFRYEMAKQIDRWAARKQFNYIDSYHKRIFCVLAGIVDGLDLDWVRGFGVYLWYAIGMHEEYGNAVVRYKWPQGNVYQHLIRASVDKSYNIVKIVKNESKARAWMLLMLLKQSAEKVTDSLISELEQNGDWQWAVFVALFSESEQKRLKRVQQLVLVNCIVGEYNEKERFVIEMNVPEQLLQQAKAQRASYEKDYEWQTEHLLRGGWDAAARQVFVTKVAPKMALESRWVELEALARRCKEDGLYLGYATNNYDMIASAYSQYNDDKVAAQLVEKALHSLPLDIVVAQDLQIKRMHSMAQSFFLECF